MMQPKKVSGQSLVEVIVVVGVIAVVITGIISASTLALRASQGGKLKTQATKYAQEGLEITRKERDGGWTAFAARVQPLNTTKHFCMPEETFTLPVTECTPPGTQPIDGVFSRWVTLSYVTASASEGGQNVIRVVSTVQWQEGANARSVTLHTTLTNWR